MGINYLPKTKLRDIDFDETDWDEPLNDNVAVLESIAPVSDLMVTTAEVPSASLNISVASGKYMKGDGTVGSYAGTSSQAVTGSSTRYVYLDSSGTLQVAGSYPTNAPIIRLATVVAGVSAITSVTDDRVTMAMPTIQRSGASQVAIVTTAAINTSPYGYATQAQADAIVAMLNEARATLVAMGVWKGGS